MNILYNILLLLISLIVLPYYGLVMLFTGKYRKSLGAKLGFGSSSFCSATNGRPRIWIHAVSVGEVTAAAPIVAALRKEMPHACLLVSTSTETGQEMARNLITDASSIFYYPLDFPCSVHTVIRHVRPDLFALTETELWPNFIRKCHKWGIKVVMVNGRISPRSYRRYYGTRFFWRQTLRAIDEMGMISAGDAERIRRIGMPSERISILGNAKYDGLAARVSSDLAREIGRRLCMTPGERVLVAGSTHEGEEAIILSVYGKLLHQYPDLKLIIVPRHINRGRAVLDLVRKAGFADCLTMTEIQSGRRRMTERVVVVDVIGELFKIYSLATVAYCGGSLVPKGGQNILEAAAWGKPVLYGPSMEDFLEEKALLEDIGVGIPVQNETELFQRIQDLLSDPEGLSRKGRIGREAIAAHRGSSRKYAALILKVLKGE